MYRIAAVTDGQADWALALQLTVRQHHILSYLADHLHEHGWLPPYRAIAQAVGLNSWSAVSYQLRQLAGKGLLELPAGRHAAIRLLVTRVAAPSSAFPNVALAITRTVT